METVSPADLFEVLRQDLIQGIPDITGPVMDTADDRMLMLYRLAENDPAFVKDQGIFHPQAFIDRKRMYKDHPDLYREMHSKFPYGQTSDIFNGKTLLDPSFDLLEDHFVNFLLDRKFAIKFLVQREIEKQDQRLQKSAGTIHSLFGIACNERASFSFYCICGFLSTNEIRQLFDSGAYQNITTEAGCIIACWGRLGFSM